MRCAILYTSRITSAPHDVRLHRVERLAENAALRLLLETTRPQTWTAIVTGQESAETRAAQQVCKRVGYLPLALVHLRGRLAQDEQATLVHMAEALRQGRLTSLKSVLFETLRWSWERVHDVAARRLFLLSCSFPEAIPIPLWLLGLAADLGEQAESFEPLGEACLELQAPNLFERLSGEQVRLHPLVREFGQDLLAAQEDHGTRLATKAIKRLVDTFVDLNALERRAQEKGYWGCLEQVRAARDYALLLHADQAAPLVRIERWLDRESYLLADEVGWRKRLPGLLYQQLANHAVEEGRALPTGEAPAKWIEQMKRVGAEDQALLRIFSGHVGPVNNVAFSPDGRTVLTGSDDKTAQLWETQTGQPLATYQGHSGSVRSVAFSPDGHFVLTGSDDGTARLWETQTGQPLAIYQGHSGSVRSVAFSSDGRSVLTGSDDGTARLWETQSGQPLATYQGHSGPVRSVAFSPDGHFVLTGSDDSIARLWETQTGQPLATYQGHTGWVNSVAFSPDGHFVLTGSDDSIARLWETQTGQPLATYQGHTSLVNSVAFSPDGRTVLTGSEDRTARLWETQTGQPLAIYQGHSGPVNNVAFSSDGRSVLTGSDDGTARLWETQSGLPLATYQGHTYWVTSVAFSPDGHFVLTGSSDDTARLWETQSGQPLATYQGHTGWVNSVAFSSDGRFVLTGSYDGTARLWETQSGQPLATYQGHSGSVLSVAFSPDGHLLATSDRNGYVFFWQTPTAGQQQECLLGMYVASYPVEAVYWQDATTVVLADRGGLGGRPHIYYLKLHGME